MCIRDSERLEAAGETVEASVFSIGNPQCVLLGPLPDDERFARLGPALERHPAFPKGTNVEFVHVEAPDRVRIRIWERGVGPTESSGTGACASAIAAIAHGGAAPTPRCRSHSRRASTEASRPSTSAFATYRKSLP